MFHAKNKVKKEYKEILNLTGKYLKQRKNGKKEKIQTAHIFYFTNLIVIGFYCRHIIRQKHKQ